MANILRKVIENDKGELRKLEKLQKVESYADQMASLSDRDLQGKTLEFKERYQKVRPSNNYYLKLSQLFVKQQNVCWACSLSCSNYGRNCSS